MAKQRRGSSRRAPRSLLASFPVPCIELEFPGGRTAGPCVAEWNGPAEKLTGLKRATTVGRPLSDILRKPLSPPLLKKLQSVRRSGAAVRIPRIEFVNGRSSEPYHATAWKVGNGVGLLLSPHAEPFEDDFAQSVSILDSITDAFFLLDGSWRFAYLSPKAGQFLRPLNMTVEELIGRDLRTFFPSTSSSNGYQELEKVFRERVRVEYETYFKPLNTWFEVSAHPLGDGVSVYIRDITRRKMAETAFLKLSNAVEQSADAVFVTNPDGVIEYVNPAFEAITGYRRTEVLGRTPVVLTFGDRDEQYFRDLWEQVRTGGVFRATLLNRRKDGQAYQVEETITPVRDAQGTITHFVATLRDVSERKRTEERFRALIEHSSDGIALLDREGIIRYTGPSTERILGYRDENFADRSGFEFIHPDDRPAAEQAYRELVGRPRSIMLLQFRLRHKDGQWLWIEATVNNLLDEPSIQSVVLNYRDITDRKHIEEALKKSEIEYRNVFERANDAIFIFEPDGEMILEVNNKVCQLYGFTRDELIGMSLKNLTKDVGRGEFEIRELLKHKSSRNFETTHFNKKGEPMEMLVNSSVVEYMGRTAIMSIIRDITELRRLEHQLRQAQKMESVGTLAGGIAHDFNNILSIILGYASLIKRGKAEGKKLEEAVDTITKAAQRGAMLVKQILTFARKTDVIFESVRINDLLTDLSRLLGETFPKTVVFDLRLNGEVPTILADPNQLHQVFLNLCVNARDAMPEGGLITIESTMANGLQLQSRFPDARQSEYVHVRITDTGTGMDEATRLRIFEPFFTTKGQGRGTGLGLAVVYGIVNNHRGFIDVESAVGKGTSFHVYFPVQMRSFETLGGATATVEQIPGGTETILLVEDEQMLQALVKELLEGHGYRVITAADGAEAVDTYRRLKDEIDLVLTDIGLPKLSGWDVCKNVLTSDPDALVIVASGYIDPNQKSDLKDSGAKDFIHKPYLPEDVLRRIRTVLDAP